MKKVKAIKSIDEFPDFDKMTYEEEAAWWETHSFARVWDKLPDIDLRIEPGAFKVPAKYRTKTSVVNVRLDPVDHQKLRMVAGRKGLGTASLVRMWVLERLQHPARPVESNTL